MLSLWKILRNLLGVSGLGLIFLSVSTSDYYVLELGCAEPAYVGRLMIAGALMMLPLLAHSLYQVWLEGRSE